MAPTDDVERPRASSAAERQKSIVSMTEFEGMDEYTALQKYILFYRDTRTNPHAEKAQKKKAWWQFWKSGSATAAEPVEDAGAVPDERKSPIPSLPLATAAIARAVFARLHCCRLHHGSAARACNLLLCSFGGCTTGVRAQAASSRAFSRMQSLWWRPNQGRSTHSQQRPPPNCSPPCSMRDEHHDPAAQ